MQCALCGWEGEAALRSQIIISVRLSGNRRVPGAAVFFRNTAPRCIEHKCMAWQWFSKRKRKIIPLLSTLSPPLSHGGRVVY
jgi:hypothetical protein